jgi:hypothetical protein
MTPGGQLSRKSFVMIDFEGEDEEKLDSTDKLRRKLRKKMNSKIHAIKRSQEQMKSSF